MRSPTLLLTLLALAACRPDASADAEGDAPPEAIPVVVGEVAPVDDGAAVEGFAAFRDSLRGVIARRDTAALLDFVAEDARTSFGDTPGGPAGVRARWFEGDTPDGEPLWDVLERALAGGSVAQDDAVVFPFTAGLWPDDLDPFTTVAVPGPETPAFDAPGGETVALVTDAALATTGPPQGGWQPVALPDGREAVVEATRAYSPVGYRGTAWADGDGWRLRAFLAGD